MVGGVCRQSSHGRVYGVPRTKLEQYSNLKVNDIDLNTTIIEERRLMKKTAIFRDKLFISHDPGFTHPESPDRAKTLFGAIDDLPEKNMFLEPSFSKTNRETLCYNHSDVLIRSVAETSGKKYSALDPDTITSAKSYDAACRAVGALNMGVDLMLKKEIDNCFALVRPPGHHAERGRSMGFCLFNNVAIAAHYAIKKHGLKRILIVDWDVHHGNGTQNSFYESDEVLYISIHQSPLYPGTGPFHETGMGKGEGYTINIPLPGGQGDFEYANIFNSLIRPIGEQYKPELIIISAGFDAYHADAISSMRLTHSGYGYMTKILMEIADEYSEGKVLVSLEGGYDLTGLKEGVFSVLTELVSANLYAGFPSHLSEKMENRLRAEQQPHPAIERVREVAKKYWKM